MRVKGRPWWRARPPRVLVLHGGAQGACERLEGRLHHVVGVRAGLQAHVQRQLGRVGHRAEELLGQVGVEVADPLRAEVALQGHEGTAGDVDRGGGARLVHRHDRVAEAADPGAVAERLVDGLPERDAGVLDGVVRTRLEIALHAHVEIEEPVARHGVQQVVEEADARLALASARAVQVQRQLDVGLTRRAVYLRGAAHARRSMDSACTGKPSARARAAPAGARRFAASGGKDTRAMRRRKVAGERADWNRAAPPVGSTWFEPAT